LFPAFLANTKISTFSGKMISNGQIAQIGNYCSSKMNGILKRIHAHSTPFWRAIARMDALYPH
jgi:hypothetical protein